MAALPTVGITALLDAGHLTTGEHVLIRGAGGVGLGAVQIASYLEPGGRSLETQGL